MPVQQGVWGIDVGQSAVKALRLEMIDGAVTATAFDFIEHPKILSQPDADPDQLTREALEKFLSRNNLKGDLVAISVPGQSGLARFVKLPPVEEKKIGDIVRFEAKQQIPFPLDEVVWDYQKIGSGEVTDGFAMETEIGLFAMKRDQISRALAHFQDVNIEVHFIQMSPLALCNFVAYDLLNKGGTPAEAAEADEDQGPRGKRRCVVALDIGTDSSNLVITDGEKIIWQRPIPLGGNHLTRALSKELKLTFAKAEHLKRNAAKSPPELKTILTALKPVLGDFVGETQRSLGFFTNSHRDAQIQYMVGLGSAFRLPGFQKYLSEKLQLDVRKPSAFNRLVGEEVVNAPVFTENVLSYSVAYGLAVQGLGLAKLRTNLLPQEIQFDRMIRAKKPWAVAAACALFLGAGLLAGGYAINYRSVSAASIDDALKRAKNETDKVTKINGDAAAKEQEVSNLTGDVRGVIAGKDEQLNWIKFNEYLNLCLPNPESHDPTVQGGTVYDGGVRRTRRLGPAWLRENGRLNWIKKQEPYWNTEPAREAWRQYRDRVRGGQLADIMMPDAVKEHLFLADLEAVDCLYTDNLKAFFDRAQPYSKQFSGSELAGMCPYDRANPPKETDAGWVFEIRGSTYQKEGREFILNTLVENLARLNRKTLPWDAPAGAAAPADQPGGAAAPVAAPAAAPSAPDAAADAAKPVSPGPIDPITDQITHVFLWNYWRVDNPQPGVWRGIQGSYLRPLVAGGGPMGGDSEGRGLPSGVPSPAAVGSPDGGPAAVGSLRDSWAPLTSGGGMGGMGGMAGPGGPGGEGGFRGRGLGGKFGGGAGAVGGEGSFPAMPGALPSGVPPRGVPTGMTGSPDSVPGVGGVPGGPGQPGTLPGSTAPKPIPRYEFVIMFIWREPTPSDKLMKLAEPGAAPADAMPGGVPAPGSPGGPSN
jgi:type IV pilus assembly protein PilM